ncbi:AraC family ligand binding domain-containing protein [Pseudomonas sp. ISL-88]|uniref:AraC family ligand binding domain-containing protein n=1 Tax=Pseudomonas sp. ISL-88 TaxID=2819169 RepID=UPI001BEAF6C8|nr:MULTISPECIES: AraC family ligand binding domain-containing protein [Bacteria]MBT2711482.1 AraC family ligand binding domain-containing protein [Pseudomonas sp. ISL-88]
MNWTQLISGKIALNQFVHHTKENGAAFHIHYWGAMPTHYNNLVHKHSFFEITFVLSGQGQYAEGEKTYPLQENTIFVTRPGVIRQIKSETGLSLLYVCKRNSDKYGLLAYFDTAANRSSPAAGRRLKPLSYLGRHLSRLFVSETGVSYSEFVRRERVKQAASLLKSTTYPLNKLQKRSV